MEYEIKENIKWYGEVIDNFCILFIKLGISNHPVPIYETFQYMLLHHYLSSGFFSDEIPQNFINLELKGYLPMDVTGTMVLANYGVCRHTTDFLYHVYRRLGYLGSHLCTYHPLLHVDVYNNSENFLTNKEAQIYIDEAIKDIDLFGEEELQFTKIMGKIKMNIQYSPDRLQNHIMNIVKDKKDNRIYLFDSRYDCIGEKINYEQVKMNHYGLTHTDYVQKGCKVHTYYGTDYMRGLELLKKYDTKIEEDILHSTFYRDSCQEYETAYREFKKKNQKGYDIVTKNFNQLIKRKKI